MILFLIKLDRDTKLVITLWVTQGTVVSQLSLMLLVDLRHALKAWAVTGIVRTLINGYNQLEITKLSGLLKCEPKIRKSDLTSIKATQFNSKRYISALFAILIVITT